CSISFASLVLLVYCWFFICLLFFVVLRRPPSPTPFPTRRSSDLVGDFLADHAASADGGAARSGQGSRSARLRRHDDHAQDRYCGNRGGVEGLGGSNPTGRGHVHLVVPASPYAQDQDDLRTVDAIDDAHIARPDSTISRQGTT